MKVVKFGGTSMGCSDAILRARDIVLADKERRFVVVSAPGKSCRFSKKITDLLIEAHTQLCIGDESVALGEVLARFRELAGHLDVDMGAELERMAEEVQIRRCQRDFIVSRGEYLMAVMFAKVLGFRFVDAVKLMVIKKSGKVDERVTAENFARLKRENKEQGGIVMGGFYGRASEGTTESGCVIRTFPRGGSDYSGAVVASFLGASVYENFTDTHGVQSANPMIVPNTQTLQFIDYGTLYKLSSGGAFVIYPECLPLLKRHGVPLVIDNTFAPGIRFTTVTDERSPLPMFSITYENRRNIAKNMAEVLVILEQVQLDYDEVKETLGGDGALEVYITSFKSGKRGEVRLLTISRQVCEVVRRLHQLLVGKCGK